MQNKNQKELLSIIIPNYNGKNNHIKDCLDSILNQTYKNIEIIISDDCSTNHSLKIIQRYKERYPAIIKIICHSLNRGVAYNRHSAILEAKGEYITTLDIDDFFYDIKKLEKEMKVLEYYKNKYNKDIIAFSDTVIVSENKKIISRRKNSQKIKQGMIFDYIITRSCVIPRDFIIKKSQYFEVGGYDTSFKTFEDWDLKIRLSSKFEFYYTGIKGTAYRQHSQGLSSSSHKLLTKNLHEVFQKNIHLATKNKKTNIINSFNLSIQNGNRNKKFKSFCKKNLPDSLLYHIKQIKNKLINLKI